MPKEKIILIMLMSFCKQDLYKGYLYDRIMLNEM